MLSLFICLLPFITSSGIRNRKYALYQWLQIPLWTIFNIIFIVLTFPPLSNHSDVKALFLKDDQVLLWPWAFHMLFPVSGIFLLCSLHADSCSLQVTLENPLATLSETFLLCLYSFLLIINTLITFWNCWLVVGLPLKDTRTVTAFITPVFPAPVKAPGLKLIHKYWINEWNLYVTFCAIDITVV